MRWRKDDYDYMAEESQATFRKWLDETIEEARVDAKETADCPNSYGHDYDEGIRDGLKKARSYFTGEEYITFDTSENASPEAEND